MLRRYVCERRELERRENIRDAIARHYSECERREIDRRASDSRAIIQWVERFHLARIVQVDL
jgi:hypothetical protein